MRARGVQNTFFDGPQIIWEGDKGSPGFVVHSKGNEEYLTPPEVIRALGIFDLDPCSPFNRPWPTAIDHFTKQIDGLTAPWFGRVWLNPPYGKMTGAWLKKLAEHGNGIALIFARTETKTFFEQIWNRADAILFLKGRINFCNIRGDRYSNNGGAPSCLVAYGKKNVKTLEKSGIAGHLVKLRRPRFQFQNKIKNLFSSSRGNRGKNKTA